MPLFKSNKDFDSSVLLWGMLVLFAGHLGAIMFIPHYASAEISSNMTDFFEKSFAMLILYFFGKQTPPNPNGEVKA